MYKTSMYKIDGKPDIESVLFDLRALHISYSDVMQDDRESSLTAG